MLNDIKSTHMDKLWKPFLVLFLLGFLIVNWDSVSWIFNYKAVFGMVSKQFERQDIAAARDPVGNGGVRDEKDNEKETERPRPLPSPGVLQIPKLDVSAPLIFVSDTAVVQDTLAKGVVHWPESVLPGEKGQTFILGHSAPPNWPKIRYEWVFSKISRLSPGDEIFVSFDGKDYSFRVTRQIFLERGEEIPKNLESNKSFIYLITCWPPGKDIRRLAVEAELIQF